MALLGRVVSRAPRASRKDTAETSQPRHSVVNGRWAGSRGASGSRSPQLRRAGPGIRMLPLPECRGRRINAYRQKSRNRVGDNSV